MSNRKPSAYSIPPAGKISALRQRMIDDMTVRNLAPNTMLCYLKQVHYLARYFRKSPEQLSREDIREYQLYLAKDRKVSVNSRLVATAAFSNNRVKTVTGKNCFSMLGRVLGNARMARGRGRTVTLVDT